MSKKISFEEIFNKRYNKIIVVSDVGIKNNVRYVIGKCDCGNIKQFRFADIKNGSSTNCGCVRSSGLVKRNYVHGLVKHPLNRVWRGMKERCYYKEHANYKYYGGRGIVVCDEWLSDFKAFYDWAIDNGYRKGLHIDRIKNDGDYEPDNCRFVTPKENNRNTRANRIIEYNGVSKCLSEWTEELGVYQNLIVERIDRLGWTVEKALTTPVKSNK